MVDKVKILSLGLSTFSLLFSLVSCVAEANTDGVTLGYGSPAVAYETYETNKPPENGWTHEQISNVTYLCGKPFSLPCKLEDLPDDFEIGKVRSQNEGDELRSYITVNGQDSNFYTASLLLDGESAGLAHYYEDGTDKIVFCIDLSPDLHGREVLVINGINQNSSFSEVEQALGKFALVEDFSIPCFYDYKIIDSEYPEEYIRVMAVYDYEDEEIVDEAGVIGFGYSLFEVKTNETIEWSPDDVHSIECNGVEIELPCMLSDVEKSFETKISESQSGREYDMVELYSGDEHVGAMSWGFEEYDSAKDCLKFIRLTSFSFNGLTEKSSKDDIQKKLGKGTKMDSEYADWYWGDRVRLGFEYYTGENTAIAIYVYEGEEA